MIASNLTAVAILERIQSLSVNIASTFCRVMHAVQSAVLLSYVVRPSVCPSVTMRYRGHIGQTDGRYGRLTIVHIVHRAVIKH